MKNIALVIEYEGSDYCGWQRQPGLPTIQASLEEAIWQLTKEPTILYGASRTDSGVHAMGQVASFSTVSNIPPESWRLALNEILPKSIRVVRSNEMVHVFHAQKGVHSKIYHYRVLNQLVASALDRRVFFYPRRLDWKRISESLPYFVGTHDFRSFQAAGSKVKTSVRQIFHFELKEEGPSLFRFEIEGSGFLKQMVRAMIGTLIEVGEAKRRPEDIPAILSARCRSYAGRTLPPEGLVLVRVNYKEAGGLC